jgi:hypothetical protein
MISSTIAYKVIYTWIATKHTLLQYLGGCQVNNPGFVYKWTYQPTKEYYIGIHKGTTCDGYTGSGIRFTKKFNNTPREQWHRDIIIETEYDECIKIEKQLVTKEVVRDPLCLNMITGGRAHYGPNGYQSKGRNYRTQPQEVTLDGVTYPTRMWAIKQLGITFKQLDELLIEAGWPCKYNIYNRW